MVFSPSKDVPYTLGGSFIGILGGAFGFVFAEGPGHSRGFPFQSAAELRASTTPHIGGTLALLNVLESRLGLL